MPPDDLRRHRLQGAQGCPRCGTEMTDGPRPLFRSLAPATAACRAQAPRSAPLSGARAARPRVPRPERRRKRALGRFIIEQAGQPVPAPAAGPRVDATHARAARDDRTKERTAAARSGRQRPARRHVLDRVGARLRGRLREEHAGRPARAGEGRAQVAHGDRPPPPRRRRAGTHEGAAPADRTTHRAARRIGPDDDSHRPRPGGGQAPASRAT